MFKRSSLEDPEQKMPNKCSEIQRDSDISRFRTKGMILALLI